MPVGQVPWNKGKKMSLATRAKMSALMKGTARHTKPHSVETKARISASKKGKPSNRKGSKHTLESRQKLSLANKGKPIHSQEQKDKWKVSRKGKNNPSYKHGLTGNQSYWRKIRQNREREAVGFHSEGEWETLKAQYGFTCPSCKKPEPEIKLTRDHIIPLVKGGSHFIENIQPLCQSCNSRKHTQVVKYLTT